MTAVLEKLIRHDAWTTRQLLLLAQPLSDEELDREFDIGLRTLRHTFRHIIRNMEAWHDLMNGGVPRTSLGTETRPAIAELMERLDYVTPGLLALVDSVTQRDAEEAEFVDILDSPPRRKPLTTGLIHLATHGMHHRAQCLYLLRQLGVRNLIEGDVFSWELSFLEIEDWPLADRDDGPPSGY